MIICLHPEPTLWRGSLSQVQREEDHVIALWGRPVLSLLQLRVRKVEIAERCRCWVFTSGFLKCDRLFTDTCEAAFTGSCCCTVLGFTGTGVCKVWKDLEICYWGSCLFNWTMSPRQKPLRHIWSLMVVDGWSCEFVLSYSVRTGFIDIFWLSRPLPLWFIVFIWISFTENKVLFFLSLPATVLKSAVPKCLVSIQYQLVVEYTAGPGKLFVFAVCLFVLFVLIFYNELEPGSFWHHHSQEWSARHL